MDRGQWPNLTRTPGLHPYSFSKDILGFLMTTESQDQWCSLRDTQVYAVYPLGKVKDVRIPT